MSEVQVTGRLDDEELEFTTPDGVNYNATLDLDQPAGDHLAVVTATDAAGNRITEQMVIHVSSDEGISWTPPKIDWFGSTDEEGVYSGDRFNNEDYNRIKNNLNYLRELAVALYPAFAINFLGDDKTKRDFFYADEINKIEDNIDIIAKNTANFYYGEKQTFYDNGKIFDYNELNRIESAILNMYEQLTNQYRGRRMLSFPLGARSEVL